MNSEHSHGLVHPDFSVVASAFEQNFSELAEEAAAFCLYVRGQKVVDLWGGKARQGESPMAADSLMRVASCSKGITATVLGVLYEAGLLNPNQKVTEFWPEFGVNGKADVTIGMVASHQAGLPFPPIGSGLVGSRYFASPELAAQLAAESPWWAPGSAVAYHPATAGAILGEVVRIATGKSIGTHLRERIAEPLRLEMWIGLPAENINRVVLGTWDFNGSPMTNSETAPIPGTYAEKRLRALAEASPFEPDPDSRKDQLEYYALEMPAVGAITDARSLAKMYAATLGAVDGVRLFSEETRLLMTTSFSSGKPLLIEQGTAGPDLDFGYGYQLATESMPGFGPNSFGHTGAGGRLGLADPDHDVALGYICSSMRNIGPQGDPRWKSLIDATKVALGIRGNG